jgi:hypothetical protein
VRAAFSQGRRPAIYGPGLEHTTRPALVSKVGALAHNVPWLTDRSGGGALRFVVVVAGAGSGAHLFLSLHYLRAGAFPI